MNVFSLVQGLGSIGFFSSRVFLPALLTALLIRFGDHVPILAHTHLLAHVHHQPAWFTSNPALIVLTALSVLEILAQKNPEARRLLHEFDVYLKSALAFLTSVGVMSATDAEFVKHTAHQAGLLDYLVPLLTAAGTFHVSSVRKQVVIALLDHVEGTHLDRLFSWAEDAWVVFGMFLLVLFPILCLVLLGAATGALFLLRKRLHTLEEQSKIACTRCGVPVYPCAIACPACRQPVEAPHAVGFLGQSKPYPTEDPANHPYRLVEKRRCPVCATRLKGHTPSQTCAACGNNLAVTDPGFVDGYDGYVARRLPVVLVVCFLLSLVPVIGLIVGAIYYRVELVAPFSQYLPLGRRFLLRWGIRLLFLLMALFQWVPLLGGFVVPLMAFVSYAAYRGSYRSLAQASLEAAPVR